MSNKNKDVFWSVVFVGFAIIVAVCSVAATMDNKINMLNAMEQHAINSIQNTKSQTTNVVHPTTNNNAKKH